jgi:hypothetical protein
MASLNGLFSRLRRSFDRFSDFATRHRYLFLGYVTVFLIDIILLAFVGSKYGTLQFDEGAHSAAGIFVVRLLAGRLGDPVGYFASYPLLDLGVWFYPFLYSSLAGLSFSVFGFGEFAARLPSLIFSILLVHATICVARELTDNERVALISGFFAATSPLIIIVGSGAMIDVPATALTTYSILFWIKGLRGRSKTDFLKAGALGGLAALMRPPAIFVLIFAVIFALSIFVFAKNRLILSKAFWLGIIVGGSIFSVWIVSALLTNLFIGGWFGSDAINGVKFWFGFAESISGYVPSWYSPQWYTLGGWLYYLYELIFMMGFLAFAFSFVGIFSRLKKISLTDSFAVFFVLGLYLLQTIISNKNPRYALPFLPLLYVYAGVGLYYSFSRISGKSPIKPIGVGTLKRGVAMALVVVALVGSLPGLFSAVESRYLPGMAFGTFLPYQETLHIITNDGTKGLVMPDVEVNSFNTPTLTFYLASIDSGGRFGCIAPLSSPADIFTYELAGKTVRYVLVYDQNSSINKFISLHPDNFSRLGKNEDYNNTIFVYKVLS